MNVITKGVVLTLSTLGAASFGFAWRDIQSGNAVDAKALNKLFGDSSGKVTAPEQIFQQSYNHIRYRYYGPVKPDDLRFAGMQGLLGSLGDPHTVYLPPKAAQLFSEETSGNFFGVGARLGDDPLGAKVVTVFEDGPAFAAGLRANDVIIAVDSKKVGGMPTDGIVLLIKGKEGTFVSLTIARPGRAEPLSFRIKRARILVPTVESKLLPESRVGYLSVLQFAEPTALQFDRELDKLQKQNLRGLVIDLRGNPGGLLDVASDMLGRFVSNKVVVKMIGRNDFSETVRTPVGQTKAMDVPVAILIDENSASASEIFAGVLKDYNRATLVGTHSYGKSSVQNVFPLIDRSSAKVTIAKYFLPGGADIDRKVDADGIYVGGGLQPDVKVELDTETNPELGNPKSDNQLKVAVDAVLKQASR
jgi:carboxyl-terminal processing protease